MSSNPLWNATFRVGEADLEYMTLEAADLPESLHGYQLARSGPLDNQEMAENGFRGSTADRFRNAGRIGGFMREFVPTVGRVSGQRGGLRGSHGGPPVRESGSGVGLDVRYLRQGF